MRYRGPGVVMSRASHRPRPITPAKTVGLALIAAAITVWLGVVAQFGGVVGGGDAKVAASVALWFGFAQLMNFLLYASLFGGALTLLLLQFRQWPLPYGLAGQAWLARLHAKESGIPYGIALALSALLVYPETEWVKAIDLAHLALR